MRKIILASSSPRRKKLLEALGITFTIEPSNYEEDMSLPLSAEELAKQLSFQKAQSVAQKYDDAIIIAADTFVVLGDEYLGKPKDLEDAKNMLQKLSGTMHHVITGYTIIDTATHHTVTNSVTSKIFLKTLVKQDIDNYVETYKPLDKSGSYAIYEIKDMFVDKIEGDVNNIVGLPIRDVAKDLKTLGIKVSET